MNFIKYKTLLFIITIGMISIASSCGKEPEPEPESTKGKIQLNIDFYNDNAPMEWGLKQYTNAAGNEYSAYYVRFFISRLTIYKGTTKTVLNKYHNSHYFDSDIENSMQWTVADDIEEGNYDSLSFTFGFNDEDNESFMFVNQPEANMVWPENIGGGYHAMQLDGKWRMPNDTLSGYNFHLGPGQIYDTNGDITGFVDNSFILIIPASDFNIKRSNTTSVKLRMNIDKWFTSPIDYDHNTYGGSIMENQDAMEKVLLNGRDVFSVVK